MTNKKPAIYTFAVLGTGQFPLDMLRYDSCYPKSQDDTGEMERSFLPRNRDEHRVTLVGAKEPTVGRWQSFGWVVE
jgi:hypothetical protein